VQRLTAEPDNKQTFRPVQPREFVEFITIAWQCCCWRLVSRALSTFKMAVRNQKW
jgi:hypothetical protein